jgi:hypothetical protein
VTHPFIEVPENLTVGEAAVRGRAGAAEYVIVGGRHDPVGIVSVNRLEVGDRRRVTAAIGEELTTVTGELTRPDATPALLTAYLGGSRALVRYGARAMVVTAGRGLTDFVTVRQMFAPQLHLLLGDTVLPGPDEHNPTAVVTWMCGYGHTVRAAANQPPGSCPHDGTAYAR